MSSPMIKCQHCRNVHSWNQQTTSLGRSARVRLGTTWTDRAASIVTRKLFSYI